MIDAGRVAFLYLDLQKDLVGHSATNPLECLSNAVRAIATLAEGVGAPCFTSVIPFGTPDPEPIDAIGADGRSPVIARAGPKLFAHSPSVDAIRALDRPVLAMAGVLTEVVVFHAATAAVASGYEVHVLIDACGGLGNRTEDAAIREMRDVGVRVGSVASFATSLVDTFATPQGMAVGAALQILLG